MVIPFHLLWDRFDKYFVNSVLTSSKEDSIFEFNSRADSTLSVFLIPQKDRLIKNNSLFLFGAKGEG
jgi:hypothetical protein